MVIKPILNGQTRKISGVVSPAKETNLSFQVPGRVEKMYVFLGDSVVQGQVLAVLDRTIYLLKVQSEKAKLAKAIARHHEKKEKYIANKKLYEKHFIGKVRYESMLADYDAMKGEVALARAELKIAEKDLRETVMKAPFAGSIPKRHVDPHTEVKAGQAIYLLHAKGDYEIDVQVPDAYISYLKQGQRVSAKIVSIPSSPVVLGVITEIGTSADRGNVFPVTIRIKTPHVHIRPGMSAEVTFSSNRAVKKITYLLPIEAIVIGKKDREGYIFVYNPKTSVVKKVQIQIKSVRNNFVEIDSGVKAGDIIATAGVHFLRDGQKVTLWKKKTWLD